MSSVDWRHFGTERRPHTCSRGRNGFNSESRNDVAKTERKDKRELTNMEEKASLPTR